MIADTFDTGQVQWYWQITDIFKYRPTLPVIISHNGKHYFQAYTNKCSDQLVQLLTGLTEPSHCHKDYKFDKLLNKLLDQKCAI